MNLPVINWEKFLQLEYWFEGIAGEVSITPEIEKYSFFFWFFLSIFSISFSVGVILLVAKSFLHEQNPLQKELSLVGNTKLWIGILGTAWFLLRQLRVGFLGARFWLLVFLIWFIVVAIFVIRYFIYYYKFERLYFEKVVLKKDN